MSDRREEILNHEHFEFVKEKGVTSIYPKKFPEAYKEVAINAMDSYMKECCLDLLAYMSKNKVVCGAFSDDRCFNYQGQWITKEQLFENFL